MHVSHFEAVETFGVVRDTSDEFGIHCVFVDFRFFLDRFSKSSCKMDVNRKLTLLPDNQLIILEHVILLLFYKSGGGPEK